MGIVLDLVTAMFVLLAKSSQKVKFKFKKRSDFGGFYLSEVRGKKSKKLSDSYTWFFHCVAKNIER
jgi:hypothetical protein